MMEREEKYEQYDLSFDHSSLSDASKGNNFSFDEEIGSDDNKNDKRFKKTLENDEISSLFLKKTSLQRFIETIGENAFQPIRMDILEHCEKLSLHIPNSLSKDLIMRLVKNRVDKMIKNKRIKKNWSEEDIKILVWVISKYCQYHGIFNIKDGMTEADWSNIADLIPGVTGKNCMFKWLSLKKNNLAENSWIEEESLLLDEMVKKYGEDNWCLVSEELFLKNTLPNKIYRCPKQCREHWNCYLNPQLKKGPWDKKEDYLLLRAVLELQGVKKWAEIVKMFNGRTENALKNRFNLIVEKEVREVKCRKKLSELEIVENYLKKHDNQFPIDQNNLKFLSEKRQFLNENFLKKKPKKVIPRKKKEEKMMSEEEEYIPDDTWKSDRKQKGKITAREVEEALVYPNNMGVEQIKEESLNQIQIKRYEQIFEEDEEFLSAIKWEKEMAKEKDKKNFQTNEEHTKEEIPGIEANGVCFVPYSDQVMSMLKNHTLIPSKITEANQIVYLKMAKRAEN